MGNNPHNYSILNQTYESDRDHDGASENERFSVNVASNIQANDGRIIDLTNKHKKLTPRNINNPMFDYYRIKEV